MKKFDKLLVTSFMGPYLLSFFVAEFVLVMQFLWKYIDEILGKGFSLFQLLELILYFMVTQIPMALPIAILISSVMVFGNMSERHELSSMKSAGVSLLRIMRPGIMIALATAALSLLASNYLKPQANFKFQKRFRTIQSQKPSLTIEEKIFNKDFKGFAIRVDEKDKDGEGIRDVSVYDHTQNDKSLLNFIKSDSGRMYNSEDGSYFVMELYNGTQYSESQRKRSKKENRKKYPFMRTDFEMWRKYFDLGEFDSDEDGVRINRNKEDMLNTFQLLHAIDSVDVLQDKLRFDVLDMPVTGDQRNYSDQQTYEALIAQTETIPQKKADEKPKEKEQNIAFREAVRKRAELQKKPKSNIKRYGLSAKFDTIPADTTVVSIAQYIPAADKKTILTKAVQSSARKRDKLRSVSGQSRAADTKRKKYVLRLHQQYAFATICVVFMFIGGPLGSIIRKGGYGYPLLIAILFYMVFIITTIMGEKLVRSDRMEPIVAAWFSIFLVAPIALTLTFLALKDIGLKGISFRSLIRKKN